MTQRTRKEEEEEWSGVERQPARPREEEREQGKEQECRREGRLGSRKKSWKNLTGNWLEMM